MAATEGILLLSKIKENPANPRIIKDDKFKSLVKSIADFPEMLDKRPMVCVTEEDGTIIPIGGNMRLKAIKELGYKEIPESWVAMADDWSEEKRREFIIKDNISGGEWDWEELANEWDSEQLEEWGLDLPGFDVNNETEHKDLSGDLKETFEVIISCNDETHQEQVYNKMIADGFNVRALTL